MNSRLYECQVMHARFAPTRHRFAYRIFLFAIDLDELPALHHRLRLFSLNRANLFSFRESDFLPPEPVHNPGTAATVPSLPDTNLKQRVLAHLAAHGVPLPDGRIELVTLPRVLGYLFNPVSFYFCYDRSGQPVAALSEVTNTFREMKVFTLGPKTRTDAGAFHLRVPKNFYVSPFSDVDVAFDFHLRSPSGRLALRIDDFTGAARTLTSTLTGRQQPLTDGRLAWFSLKYPLLTLRIITLIHWHALRLWFKKTPWFAKAARATEQNDLRRPHTSLTQPLQPNANPIEPTLRPEI